MGQPLANYRFPLFVWTTDDGIILANDSAAELVRMPLRDVIGPRAFFLPRSDVERTAELLASGSVDRMRSKRVLVNNDGEKMAVWAWSRPIELEGRSAAITLIEPRPEVGHSGRDPVTVWRALTPIAIGIADGHWIIRSISCDVSEVLGCPVTDVVGRALTDLVLDCVDQDPPFTGSAPSLPAAFPRLRLAGECGGSAELCLLVAPLPDSPGGGIVFAIVGQVPAEARKADRVAELELRLSRIGTEVRAAGVLGNVQRVTGPGDHPQLAELTSRQWEILSLILQGLRVPAIATELFLSASTVRNHLATIFRKFGVHSQSELLELLRRPTWE